MNIHATELSSTLGKSLHPQHITGAVTARCLVLRDVFSNKDNPHPRALRTAMCLLEEKGELPETSQGPPGPRQTL